MTATQPLTLLEKAAAYPHIRRVVLPPNQLLELALAYANGDVTCTQAAKALNTKSTGNAVSMMSSCLMTAIRNGAVRIERAER